MSQLLLCPFPPALTDVAWPPLIHSDAESDFRFSHMTYLFEVLPSLLH